MPTSAKSLFDTIMETVEELLSLGKNVAPYLRKLATMVEAGGGTPLTDAERAELRAAASEADEVINKPVPDDDGTFA